MSTNRRPLGPEQRLANARQARRQRSAEARNARRRSEILKRPRNGVFTRWTMTPEQVAEWDRFYERTKAQTA